jgi:tetratricopeptide (TPR) repeat protein
LQLSLAAFSQQPKSNYSEEFRSYNLRYGKYRNEGKTDRVFFIAKHCLRLAQASQNDTLLSKAYNLLGHAFLMASDFAPAFEYYFKGLSLAEEMQNFRMQGNIAGTLSYAYCQVGNYKSGTEYGIGALKALLSTAPPANADISVLNNYYSSLSNTYDNIGVSFIGLNQPDSALHYLQLGYASMLKSTDKEDVYYKSVLLADLARTYELLKEDRMADDYFRQSVELTDSLQMLQNLAYAVKYYGDYLLSNKRLNDVIYFGRKGITAAIQSGDRVSAIDIARLLQNAYDATGRKDSAFFFSKIVNNYRDTVFSTQKLLAMQNTVLKRQIAEKERSEQQTRIEEERKHNLQYAAIALILVSFVIFFFILSHSIIANQRLIRFLGILALLIVFEFLNLLLHPYIATVTHHSPVLMLGVMVCLAALLIPLHHKLEHWITHKMVEKNNKIRLTAARKTIERLERTSDIGAVEESTND